MAKYSAIGSMMYYKDNADRMAKREEIALRKQLAEKEFDYKKQLAEQEHSAKLETIRASKPSDEERKLNIALKQAEINKINAETNAANNSQQKHNLELGILNLQMETEKKKQKKIENEIAYAEQYGYNAATKKSKAELGEIKARTERMKAEAEKIKQTGNIETKQAGVTDDVIISIVEDPQIQYGNQQKGKSGWAFVNTMAAEKTLAHEYAESLLEYAKTKPSKYDSSTGEFKPGVEKEAIEEGSKYAKKDMETRIKKIKGAVIQFIQSNPNATPDEVRRFTKKVGVDTFKPVPKMAVR